MDRAGGSPVVDTRASAHATVRPVAIEQVEIRDRFWAPRMRTNREVTIPALERHLWETGRFDNLQRASGRKQCDHVGREFNDSDVYKWLEAASWSIASGGADPGLIATIDRAIDEVAAAQGQDGYLNSYFMFDREPLRWTDHDLHEMYCAGHLIQAAVAHYRATGSRTLLEVACRFADHIDRTFGPGPGQRAGTDGHPEIELALVELARATGDQRYLALAGYLLDVRGHGLLGNAYDRFGVEYHQDHVPYREMTEIVGHAVRAVYLNAGAADIWLETGDPGLGAALHALWSNMTGRKMYASGGIGSRFFGESFGPEWELPNATAYNETCAAIGSTMWNWRMLLAEGDARYADIIELQLYNAMLAGASLDGQSFFYENPLEDDGKHRRSAWFEVACCPPNVARTLASLPGYLYGASEGAAWIHLYMTSTVAITLPGGEQVSLQVETDYPWDGRVRITVAAPGAFALKVRVPGWCGPDATLSVNGVQAPGALVPGTYATLDRAWQAGDAVEFDLPMPVRLIEAHPFVRDDAGRVALMRGPLLYCLEGVDNPGTDLHRVMVARDAAFRTEHRPDLLGGVTTLVGEGVDAGPGDGWDGALYRSARPAPPRTGDPVTLTAIPYFAWANREPGPMRTWVPVAP